MKRWRSQELPSGSNVGVMVSRGKAVRGTISTRSTFGLRPKPEPWTTEHITNGVPTINELTTAFRPTELRGLANTAIWMDSMRVQYGPGGLFRRLRFITRYIAHRRSDQRPPFKGCLIVVDRASTAPPAG